MGADTQKSTKRKNGTLLGTAGNLLGLPTNGDYKTDKTHLIDLKGRPSSSAGAAQLSATKPPQPLTTATLNSVSPLINPPNIESNVIKIIQREWDKDVERLDIKKLGIKGKLAAGDKSLVQSGHAEIESNKILYIFGNALEVLQRSEFYDQVEEMHLTYVRFDLIVYH